MNLLTGASLLALAKSIYYYIGSYLQLHGNFFKLHSEHNNFILPLKIKRNPTPLLVRVILNLDEALEMKGEQGITEITRSASGEDSTIPPSFAGWARLSKYCIFLLHVIGGR